MTTTDLALPLRAEPGETVDFAMLVDANNDVIARDLSPETAALIAARLNQWEQMREALRFYADGGHFSERDDWNCAKMGELPPPPELLDRGETAKAALAAGE